MVSILVHVYNFVAYHFDVRNIAEILFRFFCTLSYMMTIPFICNQYQLILTINEHYKQTLKVYCYNEMENDFPKQ